MHGIRFVRVPEFWPHGELILKGNKLTPCTLYLRTKAMGSYKTLYLLMRSTRIVILDLSYFFIESETVKDRIEVDS